MIEFNIINGICYVHGSSIPTSGKVEALQLTRKGYGVYDIAPPVSECLEILPNIRGIKFNNFNPKEIIDNITFNSVDGILIKTDSDIIQEKLVISKSLLRNIDFVFALNNPRYKKPGSLCVFTSVYNDVQFLDLWLKYYSKIVGKDNLYVIDHGSSISYDKSKANFIKIPRGEYDSNNLSLFNCYFQRFLLSQYKWVLHSDCDELIFVEEDNDFNRIISSYNDPVLLSTQNAFEVVYHPQNETDLDYSSSLLSQRSLMLPSESFQKTYLTSAPVTWGPGFHKTYERKTFDNRLWALHIKFMDPNSFLNKNKAIWKDLSQSQEDAQIFFVKKEDSIYSFDSRDKIDKWINSILPSTINIPNWMKKHL